MGFEQASVPDEEILKPKPKEFSLQENRESLKEGSEKLDQVLGFLDEVVRALPRTEDILSALQKNLQSINPLLQQQAELGRRLAFSAEMRGIYQYVNKRNNSDKNSSDNYPRSNWGAILGIAPSLELLESLNAYISRDDRMGMKYAISFEKLLIATEELWQLNPKN